MEGERAKEEEPKNQGPKIMDGRVRLCESVSSLKMIMFKLYPTRYIESMNNTVVHDMTFSSGVNRVLSSVKVTQREIT